MQFKFHEDGKNITVLCDLNTEKAHSAGLLSVFADGVYNPVSTVPNDVVIALIKRFQLPQDLYSFKYESQHPFWFFHDLCHALYTPDLFIPKIIEIPWSRESQMYVKAIELMKRLELPEEYLTSVPELKAFI